MIRFAIALTMLAIASAQTQLDLYRQAKPSTKPVKVGTILPAVCTPGDLFLKTVAGSNLYGCIATNTWVPQTAGGAGALSVESNGTVVGTESIQNLIGGAGILNVISDSGTRIDINQAIDSAVVQTHSNAQAGRDLLCKSQSGSSQAYTCAMTPTLSGYQCGMVLNWLPDVGAAGGPTTLTIDGLGAAAVKGSDGISDPTPLDINGGRLVPIWYDCAVFRLAPSPVLSSAGSIRPSCTAKIRGGLWYTPGIATTKDDLSVCAKDSSDQYNWRGIY